MSVENYLQTSQRRRDILRPNTFHQAQGIPVTYARNGSRLEMPCQSMYQESTELSLQTRKVKILLSAVYCLLGHTHGYLQEWLVLFLRWHLLRISLAAVWRSRGIRASGPATFATSFPTEADRMWGTMWSPSTTPQPSSTPALVVTKFATQWEPLKCTSPVLIDNKALTEQVCHASWCEIQILKTDFLL